MLTRKRLTKTCSKALIDREQTLNFHPAKFTIDRKNAKNNVTESIVLQEIVNQIVNSPRIFIVEVKSISKQ